MSTIVHITGTSSGLGRALAEFYSAQDDTHVHGYSRRSGPDLPNYKHHQIDLAKVGSEGSLVCGEICEREILINNAGWIGPIHPIGNLPSPSISELFEINVSAVARWTNAFVSQSKAVNKVVISISSGAARSAIPSWSAYCASKAAVDQMTRVWNVDRPDIHFLAIAPGVVDTEMQQDIRSASEADFPARQRFVDLHEKQELKSPMEIAALIGAFGLRPDSAPNSVFSVRDL